MRCLNGKTDETFNMFGLRSTPHISGMMHPSGICSFSSPAADRLGTTNSGEERLAKSGREAKPVPTPRSRIFNGVEEGARAMRRDKGELLKDGKEKSTEVGEGEGDGDGRVLERDELKSSVEVIDDTRLVLVGESIRVGDSACKPQLVVGCGDTTGSNLIDKVCAACAISLISLTSIRS